MAEGKQEPRTPPTGKPPENSVKMPHPETRQNPNLTDIQEGNERMQGESTGRQAPNPRDKRP
ncbi:MAG TPA: hypothetical protein VHQ47_05535 [Phycisphaerae bacterium]|nr:hypothetical protein [Phycisphaerae bacterium]